jgi:hypothetical protein
MNSATIAPFRRSSGRFWLGLGVAVTALGVLGYVVQLRMERLFTPWYMPGLATLGVLFVVLSLWQRRTAWRFLGLLLVVLLAGAAWAFLLALRLPPYTGPVTVGQPLPPFTTTWADGTSLGPGDLQDGQSHVLVFFRGRW